MRIKDKQSVDMDSLIKANTFIVFGTYAADFNMIEYAQRLSHYLPRLKQKDLSNFVMIVNSTPEAADYLAKLVSLPPEIEIVSDSTGAIGKAFGVGVGWKADDVETSPYVKLFGMLL